MTRVLEGRVAFITGGSGGIGSESARLLVRDGAGVLLMGRRPEALERARAMLRADAPDAQVEIHAGDAGADDDVRRGLEKAAKMDGKLDILIPTVGGGGFMPLLMHTAESFREQLDLNIITAFLVMRYGVPMFEAGGAVVCVSSTAAVMPFRWLSAYCASKGGLEQLVRSAAEELAPAGVRVNAIRPGMTRTEATGAMFDNAAIIGPFLEQLPLGRAGVPENIAQGVRFLAGPESGWMTGQSFAIDGGHELRRNPDLTEMARGLFGDAVIDAVLCGKPPEGVEARARIGAEVAGLS
jgi:NAD(P)-dependent dehydrogenase (short-subunit alcohol dehydrogenase family)